VGFGLSGGRFGATGFADPESLPTCTASGTGTGSSGSCAAEIDRVLALLPDLVQRARRR